MGAVCFNKEKATKNRFNDVSNSSPDTSRSGRSSTSRLSDSKRHYKNTKSKHYRKSLKSKKIIQLEQTDHNSEQYERSVLEITQKKNCNADDESLIEQCLSKHFFMRALNRQARLEIIKNMSLAKVNANTYVYKINGIGMYFYIVKNGKVEDTAYNGTKKTLNSGESFGELALLHGAPRIHDVKALTECLFWVLDRNNFKKIVDYITGIHYEANKKFIESIPILNIIDNAQKAVLCNSLYQETFEKGQYIVKEGDSAHCLYFVKEGEVSCVLKGTVIRTLKSGENFGERSILVDSTRSLDVIAKTDCVCYSLSTNTLKTILGGNFRQLLYLNFVKSSITKSKSFKKFDVNMIDKVADLFTMIDLKKEEVAFRSGYIKSSKIAFVIDGSLINKDTKEVVCNRGDILFEDQVFLSSEDRTQFDIIAQPDCLLVQADTDKLMGILGGNFVSLTNKSSIINSLLEVQILNNLPQNKLEHLVSVIKEKEYKKGEDIIKQGEEGDNFYIIKKGKVNIYANDKYIRTLNEKECFGERALFFKEKRSATIRAVEEVTVFYISQNDFEHIVEGNLKEHLMSRLYLQDHTIELDNLIFCKQLGSGNFGKVSLVKNPKNNFHYALKAIAKRKIESENLGPNLELEKHILLKIDHQFIVKLVKTLKDEKNIYFLMEYVKGKELFDVIRGIGLLNKQQTQFYGGSLLLGIEYLHERKFIYRDIKPENTCVVESGFIKIIDFGTAKEIVDRTSTIIGTPHYMAPEIVLGEGYSFQVDVWSVGVCMYEFECGGVPFGENTEDPMEVYFLITNGKLEFPKFCKDNEFKNLIQQMLNKNLMIRLSKVSQIKKHPWFGDFNWEDLSALKMKPPFIPKLKKDNAEKNIPFREYVEREEEGMRYKETKESKRKKEYEELYNRF